MSYTVLPHARVLMSTDGTERMFIDTGASMIPIGMPEITINVHEELSPQKPILLTPEESEKLTKLAQYDTFIIGHINNYADPEAPRAWTFPMMRVLEDDMKYFIIDIGPAGMLGLMNEEGDQWFIMNMNEA